MQRALLKGEVNFPVCLAPMVGMTHVALRLMVRSYLPANAVTIWPTEMLSSWRLPKEELGATPETKRGDESHLVPQILGNEEEPIRESVRRLQLWGAVGVDINMGCPVRKALKHNYGVALMGDADYAAQVVAMTVKNASVPVSVKLRAGLHKDEDFLLSFVAGLEAAGASWITLHPRIGEQKRRGAADWGQIARVRAQTKIPVIGNGDVQCLQDVLNMREQTGCDSVMVGRALAARPWLLWQVGEVLGFAPPEGRGSESAPQTAEEEGRECYRALKLLLHEMQNHFTFEQGFTRFRFHMRMTGGWLEFGHTLFAMVAKAKSFDEIGMGLDRFFAQPQKMSLRTNLRE